jgi:C4-dicarboxylate-specific signal transduction histidine kinase
MHLGPSHVAARGLSDAETAAERAAELTRQLLGFSRKSPAEIRPVQINDRLREAVELFRHSVPAGVEVGARRPRVFLRGLHHDFLTIGA